MMPRKNGASMGPYCDDAPKKRGIIMMMFQYNGALYEWGPVISGPHVYEAPFLLKQGVALSPG